jgi:hypothetical protein
VLEHAGLTIKKSYRADRRLKVDYIFVENKPCAGDWVLLDGINGSVVTPEWMIHCLIHQAVLEVSLHPSFTWPKTIK